MSPFATQVMQLMQAAEYDRVEQMLSEDNSANWQQVVDDNGNTLLHEAMFGAPDSLVRSLVNAGLDVNKFNYLKHGASPLFLAILTNASEAVLRILLESKGDVNRPSTDGANFNARDIRGRSALFVAIENNADTMVIKALLTRGAEVDVSSSDGFTPLYQATYYGASLQAFSLLLAHGANPNLKNGWGKGRSAVEIARSQSKMNMVSIMEKAVMMTTLCSVHVERCGRKSDLRMLPQELLRTVAMILF